MKSKSLLMLLIAAAIAVVVMSASAQGNTYQVPDEVVADVSAQKGDTEQYIVMMEGLPVVAYDGEIAGLDATKPANNRRVRKREVMMCPDAKGLAMTEIRGLSRRSATATRSRCEMLMRGRRRAPCSR